MIAPSSVPLSPLRPLGLGEILDRSVTLALRFFPLLALIVLVVAIPRAIIAFYTAKTLMPLVESILRDSQGHASSDKVLSDLSQYSTSPFLIIGSYLLALLLVPLTSAALTVAAATLSFRGTLTFADAYRLALGRWPHIIGINFLWGFTAGAAFFVLYLILIFAGIGIVFLIAASKIAGIIAAVILGLAVLTIVVGLALLVTLAWQLSIVACVVEKSSFVDAFVSGIRRVMTRIGWKRSLLAGLTFGLIIFGLTLTDGIGANLLTLLAHQPLLSALYSTVVGILTQLITTCFMVTFYFDMRVREDGLDLSLAAAAREFPGGAGA